MFVYRDMWQTNQTLFARTGVCG